VTDAERAVVDATADLDAARQARDQATLASPIAGTVIAVSVAAGESVTASSTTAAVVVAGTAELEATTAVGIDDREDVEVGQRATVRPDGRAEALAGTVSSIAVSPTTSGTTTSYDVVIRFDEPVTDLGNGSTGTATIVTASVPDAVAVPLSALRTEGERHWVTVLDGGTPRTTEVQVGVIGDTWAEVTDGLTASETVVSADLTEPLPSSATDASTGTGFRPGTDGGPPLGGGGGPPAS
jgi:multidrug efflux pump subunit AcrA (membrane-fusion protein)